MTNQIKKIISEITDNQILASFLFDYLSAKDRVAKDLVNQDIAAYAATLSPNEKVDFQNALQQNLMNLIQRMQRTNISLKMEKLATP